MLSKRKTQALSHVKEFRECMLSDEAGVSLYAAGKANSSEPNPTPADEILSFPGFKKRKKRKKGETGDEAEETTVVPVCECPKTVQRIALSSPSSLFLSHVCLPPPLPGSFRHASRANAAPIGGERSRRMYTRVMNRPRGYYHHR